MRGEGRNSLIRGEWGGVDAEVSIGHSRSCLNIVCGYIYA